MKYNSWARYCNPFISVNPCRRACTRFRRSVPTRIGPGFHQ